MPPALLFVETSKKYQPSGPAAEPHPAQQVVSTEELVVQGRSDMQDNQCQ